MWEEVLAALGAVAKAGLQWWSAEQATREARARAQAAKAQAILELARAQREQQEEALAMTNMAQLALIGGLGLAAFYLTAQVIGEGRRRRAG